jgi:ubiquinone/menaquinone biosynthesis C-methylase UbiE
MMEIRYALMRKYFNVEDSVCDVCCGTGHYSSLLSYQVGNVNGIDFADVLIEKARQRKSLANFIVGDAREMPFEDNQFDGIISFSALYYIKEIDDVFREMHRIMKPNGVAIIELGNLYSINTLLTKGKEMQSYHITTRKMGELIKGNRFVTLEHRRFQVIMSKYFQDDMYKLLSKKIKKKMIDEYISTALSPLAFRHLFVLRKWD